MSQDVLEMRAPLGSVPINSDGCSHDAQISTRKAIGRRIVPFRLAGSSSLDAVASQDVSTGTQVAREGLVGPTRRQLLVAKPPGDDRHTGRDQSGRAIQRRVVGRRYVWRLRFKASNNSIHVDLEEITH